MVVAFLGVGAYLAASEVADVPKTDSRAFPWDRHLRRIPVGQQHLRVIVMAFLRTDEEAFVALIHGAVGHKGLHDDPSVHRRHYHRLPDVVGACLDVAGWVACWVGEPEEEELLLDFHSEDRQDHRTGPSLWQDDCESISFPDRQSSKKQRKREIPRGIKSITQIL